MRINAVWNSLYIRIASHLAAVVLTQIDLLPVLIYQQKEKYYRKETLHLSLDEAMHDRAHVHK